MKINIVTIMCGILCMLICVFAFSACDRSENHDGTTLNGETTEKSITTQLHEHSFGEWIVVKEPTCTEEGEENRSCSCGESEVQTIKATDHTESKEAIKDVLPTIYSTGREHTYCTLCSTTVRTIVIPRIASSGLTYTVNSDKKTCTVTGLGDSTDDEIGIPEQIDGYKVIGIGDGAFAQKENIKGIYIPLSVESIGARAFFNCTGLESVTIPDNVTSIGEAAFYGCIGLSRITIPNSVTSLGDSAFQDCTGLTSAEIGNGVIELCNFTFYNCTGLTSVTIGRKVFIIGAFVVGECKSLKSVTFKGTRNEWQYMARSEIWDKGAGNYILYFAG